MTTTTEPLTDRGGEPLPLAELGGAWPLGEWTSVSVLAGGKNEHLRVTTHDGVYYLRRSHRSKSVGELTDQLRLMRLLRRRGFPAPEVVRTRDGADHLELHGRCWVATRGVAGAPFDDASPAHLEAFGRILARYHRVVADQPAVVPEPGLVSELRSRAGREDLDPRWPARPAQVVDRLTALLPELPTVVVHGGARRSSLLFEGDRVVGVLDFDSAHPDVRVLDLAVAVHDVGKVYTRLGEEDHKVALDLGRIAGFLAAYRGELRPTAAEIEALPLLLEAKRLKRGLGRRARADAGEPLSRNDHAKIGLEDRRLDWLEEHREAVVAVCRRSLA